MTNTIKDIFVIGGGINGCSIARDAVGRGYSVALAEMHDLSSATSSASTKLIHGGLRYLEYYEFRLVREALKEREVVWANAPHIVWPLRFVLPYFKGGIRPAWVIRIGLFLYDHIGGRKKLPATADINMKTDAVAKPLKPLFTKAFEYSDCWVDDSRFVVLNAMDAAHKGADILVRQKVISLVYENGIWTITTRNERTGETSDHQAKMVVNAAGPWVDHVIHEALARPDDKNVRLVQGSHMIVKKMFDHDRCYIFQNNDGRIVFAIPYAHDFTLIGTTDHDYEGDLNEDEIKATEEELLYLCDAASDYFEKPVTRDDVVWSYSGVRPLYDDGASAAQEATRDYVLRQKPDDHDSSIIHVFGGKITTSRMLAEAVLKKIEHKLGAKKPAWTKQAPLPGGDFDSDQFNALIEALVKDHPYLDQKHAYRLVRQYGTLAASVLTGISTPEVLGQHFGADLYEAEVRYLIDHEWAVTAEDVLFRRTKLGLKFSQEQIAVLQSYMDAN
ncbi:glycerol-3-phosphate dehydrogenase [uncultured Cohaesibacter sp.]|uniref:glycerol-3-phosphate dehydrogenase n=1 Tax=uncultured Cohaesibacter sp. TaxID=1002546 RepID=UPI0029301311|nr:glycerol-3-phosphate dehydrogenase [uncultured Cohaesibacter sp.]